jgi:hypothetical protein
VISKSFPAGDVRAVRSLLALAEGSKIIFVVRNPYDQVYDKLRNMTQLDRNAMQTDLQSGITLICREIKRKVKSAIEIAEKFPESCRLVTFEDLVLNHRFTLSGLSGWVGFQPQLDGYVHLDVTKSSHNVGLHRFSSAINQIVETFDLSRDYDNVADVRH